jgi:hypothetical protein
MRTAAIFLGLAALLVLSGCSTGVSSFTNTQSTVMTPAAVPGVHGTVFGGQQPVSGATIQLWEVGTSGYGLGATALIGATVTTSDGTGTMDSNANAGNANNTLSAGSFTITGDYTCPTSSTLVYITATGGNPGLGGTVNNTALVLMAALGQCGSLSSSTVLSINEVTTVGSAYALAQFMGTGGGIGSPSDSGSLGAIASAFANVNNMVNVTTGAALATTSGGNTVPQSELDTLADVLVPCVNSTGPTSTACATLFSDAPTIGGVVPTTVLAAVLGMAINPNVNVSALYGISTANTAFQPTLSSAPHSWTVIVGGGGSICGYSGAGYTVSGTVSYSGTKTGRTYLTLFNTSGCEGGSQGTSISSKGSYNIRGVPPGTYLLQATMDTVGYGAQNAADPSGEALVTVGSSNVSQGVTLADPSTVTLTSAPSITVVPFNAGAVAQFKAILNGGVEAATSYTLQWSTTSSFTAIAGSQTFPAIGTHGTNVWIVNGLTDGSVYYFRAYGTSAGTAVSPYSATVGPVTIGAPSTGSAVMGSVSFTGAATGPMYVGLYDQYAGIVYAEYIASPSSPQTYSIMVPNSASAVYQPFAILDQNNDGVIDAGDIQDTNSLGALLSVTGTTANVNVTLPSGSSTIAATTQVTQQGSVQSFAFELGVQALAKLPVAVTLLSSSNSDGANVVGPMDIATCSINANSCGQGFQITFNLASAPTVGDTYFLKVVYSDGTSETLTPAVTAVLTNFATNLAPTTGTSTSTTPTFTWTAPVCGACSGYVYQFYLNGSSGDTIWGVPDNANGLPYTTTSLTWDVDPTDSSNTPSESSLTVGTNYSWSISVLDVNGNSATTIVNYQP